MSAICARLSNKGKVGVQRGRETAGVPSFLPSAVGTAPSPRRAPRRSRRPQTANPPLRFSEKLSARQGREPACGSSCAPVSQCRKGAARQGRTRLRQFVCPGQPVQKRSRPSGANPPAAVRVPRSADAVKGAARQGRTRLRQFVCPGHLVPRQEKHRRIASTVLKICTFTQIAAAYRHPYAPAPAGPVPDDRVR